MNIFGARGEGYFIELQGLGIHSLRSTKHAFIRVRGVFTRADSFRLPYAVCTRPRTFALMLGWRVASGAGQEAQPARPRGRRTR